MAKKLNNKKNGNWVLKVAYIFIAFGFFSSCVTLSEKVKQQNISIATSSYMVQGKQVVQAYTTEVGSAYSLNEIGIMAANDAAEKGWSNIIVLVQYIRPGSTGSFISDKNNIFGGTWVNTQATIVEVSFWK